jgi:hypothetical protein
MGLKQVHRHHPKISCQHTSFSGAAAAIVDFLVQNPRCSRISGAKMGKGKPHRNMRTKITATGIIINVHDGGNHQTLHVVPTNGSAEHLVQEIYEFFKQNLLTRKEQKARQIYCDKQTLCEALAPAAF